MLRLLKPKGKVIALVKPQFEAGRKYIKKGGIVDDPDIQEKTIVRLIEKTLNDFKFVNITFSPLKNSPGNIEYFIYLIKNKGENEFIDWNLIKQKVADAQIFFKEIP